MRLVKQDLPCINWPMLPGLIPGCAVCTTSGHLRGSAPSPSPAPRSHWQAWPSWDPHSYPSCMDWTSAVPDKQWPVATECFQQPPAHPGVGPTWTHSLCLRGVGGCWLLTISPWVMELHSVPQASIPAQGWVPGEQLLLLFYWQAKEAFSTSAFSSHLFTTFSPRLIKDGDSPSASFL